MHKSVLLTTEARFLYSQNDTGSRQMAQAITRDV